MFLFIKILLIFLISFHKSFSTTANKNFKDQKIKFIKIMLYLKLNLFNL